MNPLSQRDPKWKDIKLGWSTDTTIGSHGCLITCLSMLWNTTPDIVNEWLKNHNGYLNLNLVNWQALPGFEWRGWTYDNAKVTDTIKKYGSCIVETDFNTNPKDGSHFVVFVGDKKLNDPWTGKQQATSYFPVYYGYAIIDPSKNPIKEATMPEDLQKLYDQCRVDRDSHWDSLKALEKDYDEANKKISKLIEASGIAENKYTADLAKAKIDYEKLLADEKVAFKTELERIQEVHNKALDDLEKTYKGCQLPEPEKPVLTFKKKLAKAFQILFG